jgi:hypothetical protein
MATPETRAIASKETILRVHLVPLLGKKRLDAITPGKRSA